MWLDNLPIHWSIVVVAASSHCKGPGSISRGAKCIFLVATELAYKSNATERHSPEYLRTFPGIYEDIPRNVWRHSPECFTILPGMFVDIPRNVWGHSSEYLATFPEIKHSPHSPRSPHSVPRSCIPVFIHSH